MVFGMFYLNVVMKIFVLRLKHTAWNRGMINMLVPVCSKLFFYILYTYRQVTAETELEALAQCGIALAQCGIANKITETCLHC
jgi:hypothetical protein